MSDPEPLLKLETIGEENIAYDFLNPHRNECAVQVVSVADDAPIDTWLSIPEEFPSMEVLFECTGKSARRDWTMATEIKLAFEEASELDAVSKQPRIQREMRSL
jgi:hypothetical protein